MAQLAYIVPVDGSGDLPDNSLPPGAPGRPDNSLPDTGGPVDPGYGFPLPPVLPDNSLPWAPGHPGNRPPWAPGHPGNRPPGSGNYPTTGPLPPTYPVDPDYDLPQRPNVWPNPPRPEGPDPDYDRPVVIRPGLPIYYPPGGHVDNSLPLPPGSVWPPLPPAIEEGILFCFVWIPGVGYRWICIDTNLKPTVPMVPPSTVPQPKSS